MKRSLLLICAVLALAACSNKEYDISGGINKEVTLFEEEISAPIGSIGPITLNYVLESLGKVEGIGTLLADYIKVDEDGSLILDDSGDIYRTNVYELEKKMADPTVAQTYDAGYQSAFIGGMAAMLGYVGFKTTNQQLSISASNPLFADLPVKCVANINCSGSDGSYTAPVDGVDSFTLGMGKTVEVSSMNLGAEITSPLSSIIFTSIAMDLPANPTNKIYKKDGNLFLAFTYKYKCGVAPGDNLKLPLENTSSGNINLEIGKYRLKKCDVKVTLENTLPLAVTVDNVRVIKPLASEDAEKEVDENIVITSGITIPGGSLEKPATQDIVLSVEALEGTIPDISELQFDLTIASQPDLGIVALSTKQGLYVKSSSAKLSGGITLGSNE